MPHYQTQSARDPIAAMVKKSWPSRIKLLEWLEKDEIVLYIGEERTARYPSQFPLGVKLLIQDSLTTREVEVKRNVSSARGRKGMWHVL